MVVQAGCRMNRANTPYPLKVYTPQASNDPLKKYNIQEDKVQIIYKLKM